jgi:hypothetical protein
VREGVKSHVDVVSVREIVESDEAREIGDTVDITSKGRALRKRER